MRGKCCTCSFSYSVLRHSISNSSKFVTYLCLLFFVLLLSLKLDEKIKVGYAVVFLPIWIYNFLIFAGALVGVVSFLSRPPSQCVFFSFSNITLYEIYLRIVVGYCCRRISNECRKNVKTEVRCGLVVTIRAQSKLSVTTFTPFCIRNTFCFNAVDADSGSSSRLVYFSAFIDKYCTNLTISFRNTPGLVCTAIELGSFCVDRDGGACCRSLHTILFSRKRQFN